MTESGVTTESGVMTEFDDVSVRRLVEWLEHRHGATWSRAAIERAVHRSVAAFDDAPVRTYLEVLVRREADDLLRRLAS